MNEFKNLTAENVMDEHICCAISDKKHQCGVGKKKEWLKERLGEGHVFRKLDVNGKVFIEYAPLESAWAPVIGENYIYIYCLWVSGSYKEKGYGTQLVNYCIDDAKRLKKSGVCIISAKKKKTYLSDKKFMQKFGFETVESVGEYELLALSFDGGAPPRFAEQAKVFSVQSGDLTIYYSWQCPYIQNCISEVENYCSGEKIPVNFIEVDTLERAKSVPGVFNNWAVFYKGEYVSVQLLNEGLVKKLLGRA